MKNKAGISTMCDNCKVVIRGGKRRVICSVNKKHKQVQG